MVTKQQKSILSAIKTCILFECLLLFGCVPISVPLGNPFWTELGTIEPGETTRDEVHGMLGEPWYVIDEWDAEVYFREEGAIGLPIPMPHMSHHYLLVAYRESSVVDAVGSFRDWGRDYNIQKRIDGYMFDRSDWRLRLWRGKESVELPDEQVVTDP